jgi:hypothetical protein
VRRAIPPATVSGMLARAPAPGLPTRPGGALCDLGKRMDLNES